MNKKQREIYLELASEVDGDLCSFCKFAECLSGESPCDIGEPECKHPLADSLERDHSWRDLEPGDDCWGFRQAHDISFCADLVGIMLANKWESCSWWRNKKGQWKVAEVKV